ncbi:MAG: hypothetical protein HY860_05490 [Chlamydiales bacterium]|nr:hypothetical protein [Chlamydiales bacterium]
MRVGDSHPISPSEPTRPTSGKTDPLKDTSDTVSMFVDTNPPFTPRSTSTFKFDASRKQPRGNTTGKSSSAAQSIITRPNTQASPLTPDRTKKL